LELQSIWRFRRGVVYTDVVINGYKCISEALFTGAFAKSRKAAISFVTSVCPSEWNNSPHTRKKFYEIWYSNIFGKSVEKSQVSLKSHKNNGTLHEFTSMNISRSILFRMINVSDRSYGEKTRFKNSNFFSRRSFRLWDNVEKYCRNRQATGYSTIRLMCIACWITKATGTHSQYVISIAFSLQQWLYERDSILRYSSLPIFLSYF